MYDLTGTRIYSTNPIVVYTGNMAAQIEAPSSDPDYIAAQLVPTAAWGNSVAVVGYSSASSTSANPGDVIRVTSRENNTITFATLGGNVTKILTGHGAYVDFVLAPGSVAYITGFNPIQVQ